MKQDESIAIYLLLAFLTLQYASSLFRTNEAVYATDYEKLRKELQEIRETLTKKENPAPPLVIEEKKPEEPKPPPIVVRRNKLSQAPLHAKPILPASTNAPVKKNE